MTTPTRQERDEVLQKVYPGLLMEKQKKAEDLGLSEADQDVIYAMATSISQGTYQRSDGIKMLQTLSNLLQTPAADTVKSILQEMSEESSDEV